MVLNGANGSSQVRDCRFPGWVRVVAWLWLCAVLVLGWHQWQFWKAPALVADIFAVLPEDEQSVFTNQALKQLMQANERRIVVMVGGQEWGAVRQAARAFDVAVQQTGAGWLVPLSVSEASQETMAFYAPWRDALLTPEQYENLSQADPDELAMRAWQTLYSLGQVQPTRWLEDPLGLWTAWWAERAAQSPVRPRDGLLSVTDPEAGNTYAILLYETAGAAFRFDGERYWIGALQGAQAKAMAALPEAAQAGLIWNQAGIPLHVEEGAAQGHEEMNVIGWGSLLAVTVLAWLAFRAFRPLFLVALSLLIGCAAGLSVTVLVFGQVHVLTVVFGASLVGVAEDFGIHYFAARLGQPKEKSWVLMRHLCPALLVALVTSVIAYSVLAIVPFPGLRQMALFSAVGLTAAFVTVLCWFPWLDRGRLGKGGMLRLAESSILRWPRLSGTRFLWFFAAVALLAIAGGSQLRINDDLRALQPAAPALMHGQMEVARLLQMPGMAQFFIVKGKTPEEVLVREELLLAEIRSWLQSEMPLQNKAEVSKPVLRAQAISNWVPSPQRQQANRALTARQETAVLERLSGLLGEDLSRPVFADGWLSLDDWLRSPVSDAMRSQWLGQQENGSYASVVLLGAGGAGQFIASQDLQGLLARVGQAGQDGRLPGVQWIDRVEDLSTLMQRFRIEMSQLLVVGHLLVLLALCWHFGRTAWRAWLPCVIASVVSVAVLGLAGQPFQLFNVLALLLLLGMGVDYGIFLLSHPGKEQGVAWLAVIVGGITTFLSFGLLGLSSTPALRSFGLTLLIGLPVVMLVAPLLRLPEEQNK